MNGQNDKLCYPKHKRFQKPMSIFDSDKEVNLRYRAYIDDIIISRVRIITFVGGFIYLAFNLLDWIVYPNHALFFLKIRVIGTSFFIFLLLISFWKNVKPLAVWLANSLAISVAAGISVMIFSSDGSSSHYYEGINLVFLVVGIMNFSYTKHNIFTFVMMFMCYELAVFNCPVPFNKVNFYSANFFMVSTAFLVTLLTRLYSAQQQQAFMRQEQLKLNEEKLAALYSQADQLSKTDELTKIHNRRSFFDMLQNKIEASESSNSSFYLIIFDVDHFKELNDRWGHSFGDLALTKVVEVVKSNTRAQDCFGRFGGDEFILFLDIIDTDPLMRRLTKISQGVTSLNLMQKNQTVLISISIGAAKFVPQQNMTKNQLLEKADQQLFRVKKTNRGQICIAE